MSFKLKSVLAINLLIVFALVATPILLQVKQVFTLEKANPFEDSSVFNGVSDKVKKTLENDMFYVNVVPSSGDSSQSGGSADKS